MSEPFLGQLKMIGFNFAPRGWAYCDGQILSIDQNQSLYSLLGTTYGGDGRTSFALPDLRSRTPIHRGEGYQLGTRTGAETVTLTAAEIAAHTHALKATTTEANQPTPEGNILADTAPPANPQDDPLYRDPEAASRVALSTQTITNAGGSQAHNNMQPYLTIGFIIALQGLFPSRN